jgi:hypothetical protein
MTDELSTRRQVRNADPFRADALRAVGPAEVARIDAESAAMVARAEAYEQRMVEQFAAITPLRDSEAGIAMLTHIASVIALEALRCEALGVPASSWEAALRRYNILSRATIEILKAEFLPQEASI